MMSALPLGGIVHRSFLLSRPAAFLASARSCRWKRFDVLNGQFGVEEVFASMCDKTRMMLD